MLHQALQVLAVVLETVCITLVSKSHPSNQPTIFPSFCPCTFTPPSICCTLARFPPVIVVEGWICSLEASGVPDHKLYGTVGLDGSGKLISLRNDTTGSISCIYHDKGHIYNLVAWLCANTGDFCYRGLLVVFFSAEITGTYV